MNTVAKIEPQQNAIVPQSESAAIIQMIERVALNPAVDIDKMERLLQMQERIMERRSEQEFNSAMTATQSKMRAVATDCNNPQTRSRYASYAALDRAVRPIYTAQGFALSFDTADGAPEQYVRIVCHVSHGGGHSRKYHVDMPADGKGAKGGDVMTKTHAVGAGMSYGQRYLLKMIFNIAVGEDEDGNSPASTGDTITDEQVQELSDLLTSTKSNLVLFLKTIKLESLTQIGADKFEAAKTLINDTAKKRAAREAANQGTKS